jgi:hypothetical protein
MDYRRKRRGGMKDYRTWVNVSGLLSVASCEQPTAAADNRQSTIDDGQRVTAATQDGS